MFNQKKEQYSESVNIHIYKKIKTEKLKTEMKIYIHNYNFESYKSYSSNIKPTKPTKTPEFPIL